MSTNKYKYHVTDKIISYLCLLNEIFTKLVNISEIAENVGVQWAIKLPAISEFLTCSIVFEAFIEMDGGILFPWFMSLLKMLSSMRFLQYFNLPSGRGGGKSAGMST
jgi:hypothetical protein